MKALTLCLSILLITAFPPMVNTHASSSLINGIIDPSFETQNPAWTIKTDIGNYGSGNLYDMTRASTGSYSAKLRAPAITSPPNCNPCGDQVAGFASQNFQSDNFSLANLPDSIVGLTASWYVVPQPRGTYSLHIEVIFSDGINPGEDLVYFYGSNGGSPNTSTKMFVDLGPIPTTAGWFYTQRDLYRDIQTTFNPSNITALKIGNVGFGALGNYTFGETAWVDDVAIMLDRPTAIFSATLNSNLQVSFDASTSTPSTGAKIARYSWNFGDGQSTTTTQPTASHTYAHAGNARVTLEIADSAGHLANSSQSVPIADSGSTLLGTYALELVLLAMVPIGLFFGRKRLRRKRR